MVDGASLPETTTIICWNIDHSTLLVGVVLNDSSWFPAHVSAERPVRLDSDI
jgi:hypothetical protein